MKPTPKCCAICGDDIPAGQERTAALGKDDALVTVCGPCTDETPREQRDRERGYESPVSCGDFKRAVDRFAASTPKPTKRAPPIGASASVPSSHIAVRVPLAGPEGQHRDRYEAIQTLRHEPWFSQLEYVGSGFARGEAVHVFRRPRDASSGTTADPWRRREVAATPDPVASKAISKRNAGARR